MEHNESHQKRASENGMSRREGIIKRMIDNRRDGSYDILRGWAKLWNQEEVQKCVYRKGKYNPIKKLETYLFPLIFPPKSPEKPEHQKKNRHNGGDNLSSIADDR